MLQIISQRLTSSNEKMLTEDFDDLVSFTEQSYPGRLHFSPSGAGNMMGCIYADFTRLVGAATPPSPVATGLMMISSLTIITDNSMIGCK